MLRYLVAATVILLLLLGWIGVQALARRQAARQPQPAPSTAEGAGCDGHCGCHTHCQVITSDDCARGRT
jgi:hypothetical protein